MCDPSWLGGWVSPPRDVCRVRGSVLTSTDRRGTFLSTTRPGRPGLEGTTSVVSGGWTDLLSFPRTTRHLHPHSLHVCGPRKDRFRVIPHQTKKKSRRRDTTDEDRMTPGETGNFRRVGINLYTGPRIKEKGHQCRDEWW